MVWIIPRSHAQGFVARVSALGSSCMGRGKQPMGCRGRRPIWKSYPRMEITLTEPWTGAEISYPGKGMYQASATCDGYVVMWHPPVPSTQTTIVLEGHPIIENLFSVSGAHTMQALGSDWVVDVDDGPVDAPSGIPLVLIGVGGTEIRQNQASITIPNSTTTYEIQGNYSSNITVKGSY